MSYKIEERGDFDELCRTETHGVGVDFILHGLVKCILYRLTKFGTRSCVQTTYIHVSMCRL